MNETMLTIASDLRSESLTKNLTRNEVVVLFARNGANEDDAKKPLRGLYRAVRGGLPSDVFSQADIARLLSALRIGGRQGVAVAFDPTVEHPWTGGSDFGRSAEALLDEIRSANYMVDRFVIADVLTYLAFSAFSEEPFNPDKFRAQGLVCDILDREDREATRSLGDFVEQYRARELAWRESHIAKGTVRIVADA